jgi:hypothetical protein
MTIRSRGGSLQQIIANLNLMLQGWLEYFKHAKLGLFSRLDGLIRQLLRAILRKPETCPSMGRSEADHRRWTNAVSRAWGCSPYRQLWQVDFPPATKHTAMDNCELTLTELLDDPMTIAVMAAGRVGPVALHVVLSALSRKLRGPLAIEHERVGRECYAQPPCHHRPHAGAALR